jgi:hypothetical protein
MIAMGARSCIWKRLLMLAVALLCLGIATLLLALAAAAYADPPTTTPKDLPGWQRSAFTIHLDCSAGTTSGDELYATRYWMDWESAYNEKLWGNNVVGGTVWVIYSFVHYDGVHQCFFYSVGHNDNSGASEQEATKSMTVRIDTSYPTVAVSPEPTGWVNTGRSLSFSATDPNMPNASGVRSLNVKADSDANAWSYGEGTASATETWNVPAPADHSNDGLHSFEYWALDWAGNESSHDAYSGSFSLGIDTREPTTEAPSAATVQRYRMATLRYRVLDAAPNGGKADVAIKINNGRGKVVKTLAYKGQAVNLLLSARFACTLPRGKYRFFVYATDLAGNQQASLGSNKLVVR